MRTKITAILVNYNYGDRAAKLVHKLILQGTIMSVIVVDNNSTDDSLAKIKELNFSVDKVKLVENKNNLGYDKAVNIGIREALKGNCDYLMLLDADLKFQFDFIAQLAKKDKEISFPTLRFRRGGRWIYDHGGKINWIIGRSYHVETPNPDPPANLDIDFVSGGCTLIKSEVFRHVGLYDEDYFLYYGDTEFALRAKSRNVELFVDPDVIIEHKIHEHRETLNWLKTRFALQGNFIFINKCVPWYFKPTAYLYFVLLVIKSLSNVLFGRISRAISKV